MGQAHGPSALVRWLAELQYNAVRRLDTPSVQQTPFKSVTYADGRPLRGVLIADDLCMTYRRTFVKIENGTHAIPITNEEVEAQYDVKVLQARYKELQETWKLARR